MELADLRIGSAFFPLDRRSGCVQSFQAAWYSTTGEVPQRSIDTTDSTVLSFT